MASVSVCIVTYNSAKHIASCLEALSGQVHPIDRIVIVDNASTDDSSKIIKAYQAQSNIPIQLIENSFNNGFAGGQNQALNAYEADYAVVLNPDVSLHPLYISDIVAVMEHEPLVGSATGQLLFADDQSIVDSTGLAMSGTRHATDRGMGESADRWLLSGEVFGVSGAAAVYLRRMINDISLEGQFFDETFFAYKEDVDVAWRARRLGWRSYYVHTAKALHGRGWKKNARSSIPLFVRQHSYMNRFYTLIKNEPIGWHWFALMPQIAVLEAAKFAYIIIREPAMLECLPKLLRTLPEMWKKRQQINQMIRWPQSKKTKLDF
ncbi:glycosyltransferase family 2 protein [Paenibacillus harenae]|uniref:GT2 family glycosyltransferase n=1 Tax=Paenibacillus harenae TaxID=306543 RepID=A0ABT9U8C0_PAEHA|nr:glycosyltransferase family 2 protein [Paenibacillus harenae]MDQ0115241.1 GT2 family glycosyltransferase [Paenibacillus harenae]